MSARRALITGLTGQDGSFLAELLLTKGYEVVGLVRPARAAQLGSAEHLRDQVSVITADLDNRDGLAQAVAAIRPDELYHLAAPSFVPASWQEPAQTIIEIAGATATLLEAVRDHSPATRVFLASSGAIFGAAPESPQHEDTPCRPETPYATAKLAGHQLAGLLRTQADIFVCSGILYNHESERRPSSFVTRKITCAAARIKLGLATEVALGDLDAVRDWSFAGDLMQGAWLALQAERPDDYIFSSGVPHTVAELAEVAFAHVGLNADEHVRVDLSLVRTPEPTKRVGDPSRARARLGWTPTHDFNQLVARMVDADIRALQTA